MKSYIGAIILLGQNEKRMVEFKQGVNIITGDSKTGKSALVEIIDYCLCSSRSTVPKGIITDFTKLYCLTLIIDNYTYVIARENWLYGGKMYFARETLDFDFNLIELEYFNRKQIYPCKDVQKKIESALGLNVSNIQVDDVNGNSKKASLRSMVSYMFQHQNLIASKFALFYRFSDYNKRKDAIQQFPVIAGLVGQEYYSRLIRLNELNMRLKKLQKDQETNDKIIFRAKSILFPLIKEYFSLLNMSCAENMTYNELIAVAKCLPEYDEEKYFSNAVTWGIYNNLKKEFDQLKLKELEYLNKLADIKNANVSGVDFLETLNELQEKTEVCIPNPTEYRCPLCGNSCTDISVGDKKIIESAEWLKNEITVTNKYSAVFSESYRSIESALENLQDNIKKVWKQIKNYEREYFNDKNQKSLKENAETLRIKIAFNLELISEGAFAYVDNDISKLKDEVRRLKQEISGFDLDERMNKAQRFIDENMNRLGATLDFEDDYLPLNINFKLVDDTYDLYQYKDNREKIFLHEMGSGANWVSCHIVLFLSLLKYFCSRGNCPMLTTMFFDQPSQVYFPNYVENGEKCMDLPAVKKMFTTIFSAVDEIKEECGFLPQLIIVDHVDGKDIGLEKEFEKYIRKDWRNGGKLI